MSSTPIVSDASSIPGDSATIVNPSDPQNPIFAVNMNNVTKLNSSNFITWSLQVSLFLKGHNLSQHIDVDSTPPPPTIEDSGVSKPNPVFVI